jgi:hypothetical protein
MRFGAGCVFWGGRISRDCVERFKLAGLREPDGSPTSIVACEDLDIERPVKEQRMNQPGRKRVGPIVVIAVGLVVLVTAVLAAPHALLLMNPTAASLPPMLGGMPIQGAIYADQAIETIDQMHDNAFPLSSGAVGVYGPFNEAVLYISGAPTERLASRMTVEMTEKIAESDTPYTPTGEESIDGVHVYVLEGHGQKHFYYQAGKLLIWLAVDEWLAEPALMDSILFYTEGDQTEAD